MMESMVEIFTKASRNAVEQGRCILKLRKLYQKSNPVQFQKAFLDCCLNLTNYDYKKKNHQVERSLKFVAAFCGNCYNSEEAGEVDQFVVDIIDKLLLHNNNFSPNIRFYVIKIIRLIIEQISANLRNDVCDRIQVAMLNGMDDCSRFVREQSVLAVVRLQQPNIADCPIISKYIDNIITEPNPMVRKLILQKVAMTGRSLTVIFKSIASVDASVRNAAYLRCSLLEPQVLEIKERQNLVGQIAFDNHVPNRAILQQRLWPQWLEKCRAAYVKAASESSISSQDNDNGRTQIIPNDSEVDVAIMMLRMLCLDGDVDQLQQTYLTFKVVLNVHFKITPIQDLIQALKLDSKKLVPINQLTLELVFYWKYLFKHVQKTESFEEYSDNIVAELATFCEYIDKYFQEKFLNTPQEEFTWLSNQHILLHLLQMVACSDLNDDFGRNRLKQLLSDILQNLKRIHEDVVTIIIQLQSQIEKNMSKLCEYIYGIITDILRPYKISPLHDDVKMDRDFALAKLKFDLARVEDAHTAAIEAKDYLRAGDYHTEVMDLRDKIAAVPNDKQLLAEHERCQRLQHQNGRQLREEATTELDKQLRCVEMLSAIFKFCQLHRRNEDIPPILYTAKTEILDVYLESKDNEIYAKALDALSYFSLIDKDIAEEAIVIISSPIIAYRLISDYNVPALIVSLTGFTYILIKYGIEILKNNETNEKENAEIVNKSTQDTSFSRIERVNSVEDLLNLDLALENVSIHDFQAIILDMLDDENMSLSLHAAVCIKNLLENNVAVNSTVMTKLLLKWFTPELCKTNPKMLFILSAGISRFGKGSTANIGNIMEQAAMSTLYNIIEAPPESSLYACDLPKCLQFLASITTMAEPNKSEIHRNLAEKIIPILCSDIGIRSKEIYSKFLSFTDAPFFDMDAVKRFQELLENIDINGVKTVRANITKYISKLRNTYKGSNTNTLTTTTQATISNTSGSITSINAPQSIIGRPTDIQLNTITEEVHSSLPTSPGTNSKSPICSTPINTLRTTGEGSSKENSNKHKEMSYHISDSDSDSEHNGRKRPKNAVDCPGFDIVSPIGLSDSVSRHKEDNDIINQSNKRVHSLENERSSQDSDTGLHTKPNRPKKKRKLNLRVIIPENANSNNNDRNQPDAICTDLADMYIESPISSQSPTTCFTRRKRSRLSNGYTSNSTNENCGEVMTVEVDIHRSMNGYRKSNSDDQSTSPSACKQPRGRSLLLSGVSSDCNERGGSCNGNTRTGNSKLQSVENILNAIDIEAASSSTEEDSMEFNRPRRRLKKKKNNMKYY